MGIRLTSSLERHLGFRTSTREPAMNDDEFRERVQRERAVRAERDAAERNVPGERLRREIREAFEREAARPDDDAAAAPREERDEG
jgi:hypothetical protein